MKVKKLIKILKGMNPDAKIVVKYDYEIKKSLSFYRVSESCAVDFDDFDATDLELNVSELIEYLQDVRVNPNSKIIVRRIDGWENEVWDEFNYFHIYEKDDNVIIHKLDYIPTRSEMEAIKLKEKMKKEKELVEWRDGHMAVVREKLRRKKVVNNEISDP